MASTTENSPGTAVAATSVTSLRSQYPEGLLGVPAEQVLLTWQVTSTESSDRQVAYEIEASADAGFSDILESSGIVDGTAQIAVRAPGSPTGSREQRHYRVRVATESGWSDWSAAASVETGLVDPADWTAVAVGIDSITAGPSPILRTEFSIDSAVVRARLYATSLGLSEFRLNGQPVSADALAPAWTSYQERILVSTFDVTDLLREGANALGVELGDGWYRGRLGWEERNAIYGSELAAIAQLEVEYADGTSQTVVTDTTWLGSFGAVRSSGIYDGTDIDFRLDQPGWDLPGFDAAIWKPVHAVKLNPKILDQPITSGVREIGNYPMHPLGPVLDARQNVAGWVRLVVDGKRGDVVTVRHAEVLEPDGTLHTKSLRSARAAEVYILGHDGESTLEPKFTFHGFRYANVVSHATVVSATAVAISSATSARGSFESSDAALNRLHSNVQWSQRDNFVSVPTDCPQRDERLGWTGDAQAFAMTASTLFDTESFWRSWLKDLAIDQPTDGGVASVVPNILGADAFMVDGVPMDIMGRAGWADAATIVPWSVYESTGSDAVLRQQLVSMRRWLGYLEARRQTDGLLPTEFQYGDWLDPDAPGSQPWAAKVSADFVSNSFFVHSARILEAAETLVGDAKKATHFGSLADELAKLTWNKWGAHARTTQTGCAIALEFGIAPDDERAAIGEDLARLVRETGGRIATGFLGTPLVLHALSNTGHLVEAYQMLLCHDIPSWLYQVDMGATTVWERWDALRADGSIHPGNMDNSEDAHMLSFNHYAYGAVIDWVYRTVGGLASSIDAPGYKRTIVAPRPVQGIDFARTSIETGYGAVALSWQAADAAFEAELVVPFGVTAVLSAPTTPKSEVSINGVASHAEVELAHGTHQIRVTHPAIVEHHA